MKNLLEQNTKCLLIHPKFSPYSFWNFVDVCKVVGAKYQAAPLELMTVAALLPQHWEIKLLDTNVEPLFEEHFEWADIICTGGMLPQQQGIIDIINISHDKGCPVIVGGPDPTSQPNLYQSADYLVLGEGEISIPMLLDDLGKGSTGGEYISSGFADMTKAVIPRFDLIEFKNYIHLNIQFTRGCPYNCEFCDIIELYGRKPRTKTPGHIIKELQSLCDQGYRGHVDIVDDNFIGNKKNVKTILRAIKVWSERNKYPFYYGVETSVNIADDDELLQLMKDVDFRLAFIGIESPEDEVLKNANKNVNMNRSIEKVTRKISSYGMIVNGGFIMGLDNESDQIADRMIKCVQDTGICTVMLGLLYALPNTQLTRRLKLEERLFDDVSTIEDAKTDFDQSSMGLNFITSRPRIDVLKDFVYVIENIYGPKNYYDRIIRTCLNLNVDNKYRHNVKGILNNAKKFVKIVSRVGFNRTTGILYWKMFFTVLFRNPKALEWALSLTTMFIHFYKHSKFIIELTNKQIKHIESSGEEIYNQSRFAKLTYKHSKEKGLAYLTGE